MERGQGDGEPGEGALVDGDPRRTPPARPPDELVFGLWQRLVAAGVADDTRVRSESVESYALHREGELAMELVLHAVGDRTALSEAEWADVLSVAMAVLEDDDPAGAHEWLDDLWSR